MKLLINADDLGYCNDTDEGIFKTLSHDVVRSTSLMVNGSSARSAVGRLRRILHARKHISVGIHVNITEGCPISSTKEVPSLLAKANGCLQMRGKHHFRLEFQQ